ncbi:rare lipoprotein A [Bernardetia litoralis DSM 6794]|uniref:Probable endolytic peptidoglycan transglycosylase RlpA n=1 Tax=Bernardetia litoralis (strain ATCC 23117 / DSM 6794 / NBRC 15988 / NCIMB 1366 / Fx l1 / Sio-4) TaxID=880071 RepID=I4AQJ5_BERLS|nr:septal ring lytic transglycosylase RlpA family protein [Bernardetia litoralis]AFM06230.1 rare lipoprotein A [Bernardetia litoralis DSM 6794]
MKFKVRVIFLFLSLIIVSSSCTSLFGKKTDTNSAKAGAYSEKGIASYYADKYEGRTTASGEKFRQKLLTAAHRTLPFGTMVTVTNLKNEKKIRVRINDRGPFKKGRIIDVTRKGAEMLDFVRDGLTEVKIEYDVKK